MDYFKVYLILKFRRKKLDEELLEATKQREIEDVSSMKMRRMVSDYFKRQITEQAISSLN